MLLGHAQKISTHFMESSFELHLLGDLRITRHQKTIVMDKATTKKTFLIATIAVAVITLAAWMLPEGYYQLSMENEFIKSAKQKMVDYNKQLPEDRIYV